MPDVLRTPSVCYITGVSASTRLKSTPIGGDMQPKVELYQNHGTRLTSALLHLQAA
jgi:hypothetical protein